MTRAKAQQKVQELMGSTAKERAAHVAVLSPDSREGIAAAARRKAAACNDEALAHLLEATRPEEEVSYEFRQNDTDYGRLALAEAEWWEEFAREIAS